MDKNNLIFVDCEATGQAIEAGELTDWLECKKNRRLLGRINGRFLQNSTMEEIKDNKTYA